MKKVLFAVATLSLLAAWTPFPTAVGPEVPLDTPPLASLGTIDPEVTAGGHGALLLSYEPRVSRIGDPSQFFWVSALDADGAPSLESHYLGAVVGASAASSGRGYLVTFLQNGEARAIRYNDNGTRIDASPIALGVPASTISDVAWDGAAYVVVAGKKALSIGEDGRLGATRDVPTLAGVIRSAARNGVTVLINHADRFTTPTDPLVAHAIGTNAVHNLGSGSSADVAAGDPGFLVVYGHGASVFGRVLDPSGMPDGDAFEIATGENPSVAWNGTEWLVVYQSDLTVRAVPVLRAPLAPSVEISAAGTTPSASGNDGKVFVAWDHRLGSLSTEIQSAVVEDNAVSAATSAATVIARQQSDPLMTAVDGTTLLAWFDGGLRVRAMDGRSSTRTIANGGRPMAFATGEHDALLVSSIGSSLVLTRLDRQGAVLSTQQIPRSYANDYVGAAWLGDRWAVVWSDRKVAGQASLLRTIVSADGTADTPRRFGSVMTAAQGVTVVGVGSKAFVLWAVSGNGGGSTLTFIVDGDGSAHNGPTLPQRMLGAATNGTDVLVSRIVDSRVEWKRVQLDGRIPADGRVTLPEEGIALETFFTGENYLLVLAKAHAAPNRIDLSGLRVDVNGAAIDAEPVPFASAFTTFPPTFANAELRNPTTIDVAYYRALDEPGLYAQYPRLVFRSVHDTPRRRVIR